MIIVPRGIKVSMNDNSFCYLRIYHTMIATMKEQGILFITDSNFDIYISFSLYSSYAAPCVFANCMKNILITHDKKRHHFITFCFRNCINTIDNVMLFWRCQLRKQYSGQMQYICYVHGKIVLTRGWVIFFTRGWDYRKHILIGYKYLN